MKKLMIAVALLALTAFAASNVFHVNINEKVWIGANQVKPGDYRIEVANGKATLKSGKTVIEAPAKLENSERKFQANSVVEKKVGEKQQVLSIELGGTNQRLVFDSSAVPTE